MDKLCRICGSTPLQGARFCRVCGTPLKATGAAESSDPVSPLAQTIPLVGEGRPTDSIASEEAGYNVQHTARLKQEEMERLLRQTPPNGLEDTIRVVADEPQPLASSNSPTIVDAVRLETASPSSGVAQNIVASNAQRPAPARPRRMWQAAAAILLCVALVAGALAFFYSRRPASVETDATAPISISDQKKLFDEQLSQADSLMAAGDMDSAIAKLRYATKLDPTNAEAQRRLGLALEKKGERREAIEAYRAATERDPGNTAAWRSLASAQYSEGLYNDSADSYAHIINAMDQAAVDDKLRLEYADVLRLAGRTDEARALYQKVSESESFDLARRAREQLAQLPLPTSQPNGTRPADAREPSESVAGNLPPETMRSQPNLTAPPAVPPPPAPVASNRPVENSSDRYYSQALNIVQGRDVKSLQHAELLRALQLFQNVRSGPHAGDARKYEDRLGKEYDRRRKRNERGSQ